MNTYDLKFLVEWQKIDDIKIHMCPRVIVCAHKKIDAFESVYEVEVYIVLVGDSIIATGKTENDELTYAFNALVRVN